MDAYDIIDRITYELILGATDREEALHSLHTVSIHLDHLIIAVELYPLDHLAGVIARITERTTDLEGAR